MSQNVRVIALRVPPDHLLLDSIETQLFSVIALRNRSRGDMIGDFDAARAEVVSTITAWRNELVTSQQYSRSAPQSRVFLLRKCAAWVTEQLANVSLDASGN